MFFDFDSTNVLTALQTACLTPRPAHARHQIQSILAPLQSSHTFFLLASLRSVSFDTNPVGSPDPSFLHDSSDIVRSLLTWLNFAQTAHEPCFHSWWTGIPPSIRTYTINRTRDIFHLDDPLPASISAPLPTLNKPTTFTSIPLFPLRNRFLHCIPPAYNLAYIFDQPVLGWTDDSSRTLITPFCSYDTTPQVLSVDVGTTTFIIWFVGHTLLALTSSDALRPTSLAPPPQTNFSPPSVIWPYWSKGIPEFHASTLPQRFRAWRSILGPFLGPAARTILEHGFVIPRRPHDAVRPFIAKNHKTVELAPDLIDRIVAKYILTGTVEQIPKGALPPLVTHPLGLVDKKSVEEPFRIIHDNRDDNFTMIEWPSGLRGLVACAFLFSLRCWVFTIDIKAAYHTVPLRGCGGPLRRTGRKLPSGDDEWIIGCLVRDGTCTGGCDKDRLGFTWHTYYRMNSVPFGMKVSGNGLEVLTDAFLRKWRRKGVRIIIWVDDIAVITPSVHCPRYYPNAPPSAQSDFADIDTPCGGLQSCPACQEGFLHASTLRAAFLSDIRELGWLTNEKDSGPPAQSGAFIGVSFDTVAGTFHLTVEQVDKLVRRCEKLLRLGPTSPRKLAKLRGKLSWYSPCVHHIVILLRPLSLWIGGSDDPAKWDAVAPLTPHVTDTIRYIADKLPALALKAKPMWKPLPVQLYAKWLTRQAEALSPDSFFGVVGVAFVDASIHGYGFAWQASPDDEPVIVVAPPHPADPWDEQVHREASAYTRAAIFIASLGLHGRALIVSDCYPVTVAMTKGSPSPVLQQAAEQVVQISIDSNLLFEPLWVPGKELVDMGIDGLSREAILAVHDDSLLPDVMTIAKDLAQRFLQAPFTVDLFASAATAQCPRYWSEFPDPDAEGCDALGAESWLCSSCECGTAHTETAWIFPLIPLLRPTLAKIKADGIRGVLLAPVTPGAEWWPILEEASIHRLDLSRTDPIFRKRPAKAVAYSGRTHQWALFVLSYGPLAPSASDLCPAFTQAPIYAKPAALLHAQGARLQHLAEPLASLCHPAPATPPSVSDSPPPLLP